MPLSRVVNNVGIGKVEGTFNNLTTTATVPNGLPFTSAMVDAFNRGCSLMGNNEVGYNTTTYALFGAVQAVSDSETAKNFPERCVVQTHGVAEIRGTTIGAAPVAESVRLVGQRNGRVGPFTTSVTLLDHYHNTRGTIINVYDTDRVDVLF